MIYHFWPFILIMQIDIFLKQVPSLDGKRICLNIVSLGNMETDVDTISYLIVNVNKEGNKFLFRYICNLLGMQFSFFPLSFGWD